METKQNIISGLIVAFILIVGGTIYYNYDMSRINKIRKQINKEYPILSLSQELKGVITDIDQGDLRIFRNNPRQAYLTINGYSKVSVNAGYVLDIDSVLCLDDVLHIGDSLVKKANVDTFLIIGTNNGNASRYYFKLTDDLGYPLKRDIVMK